MFKVRCYMRSGNVVVFMCEDFQVNINAVGVMTGYKITKGTSNKSLMHLSLRDVEGITVEDIE